MLSYFYTDSSNSFNKKNLINNQDITIDAKSGYSGAGKNLEKNLHIKSLLICFCL